MQVLALGSANAADVEIDTDTPAINLDAEAGSTAHIAAGVTVGPGSPALGATLQAWTITNDGAVTGNNAVTLDQGGTLTNNGAATITGTGTALTFGNNPPGSPPPAGGPGTLHNYGTITGGLEAVTLWYGGTVNNYAGATISTATGLNAVSIGQGASRTLFNAGRIEATATTGTNAGVLIQGGAADFTNTGSGEIFGGYNGVYATSAFTSFSNAGSISSTRGAAVEASAGGAFSNSGTISSTNSHGILIRNTSAAEIINSGTIAGAVDAISFTGGSGGGAAHTVRLRTGSVLNGNVRGGTGADALILEGTGTESIAKFLNFETVSMEGADWSLTGAGSFTTSASVAAGLLRVNGTLTTPTLTIDAAAKLGGSGTVAGALVNNGTIAAGDNGIGTLSVTGPLTFGAGSVLETEVNPAGQTDLLLVTGAATIAADSTVSVMAASGAYDPLNSYTILTATGGVTGTFLEAQSNFAFLSADLSYDANNVYLTLVGNGVDFDAIGGTPNQRAAGRGVQGLDPASPVYDAVLVLDIPGARYAFDQLSGEIHASVAGLLLDDSRHVRDAAFSRLRDGGDATRGMWVQGYGAHAALDGDGNAAALDYNSAGVFAGLDGTLGEAWQAGALVGYSRATFDIDARNATGAVDSYHVAAYGGGRWGGFGLRAGAAYAWHGIDTTRSIAFQGFSDRTEADYDGHTAQMFGEASYAIGVGAATFEPTAGLAYVDVGADGFSETGGDAALTGSGAGANAIFSTLGVRAKAPFEIGGIAAVASGFVGWQHAFGDTVPTIDLAFSGAAPAFGIAGTPLAEDTALVQLGLDFQMGAASRLGLAYSGQYGDGTTSQAFNAAFSLAF